MSKKIAKVDPVLLDQMREKWLAIGLSTTPGDIELGKAAIVALHKRLGMTPPTIWVYMASPLRLVCADKVLRTGVDAQVYAQVEAQVEAQVRDQVYAQVRAQVYAQVGAQVRAQVYDHLPYWYMQGQYLAPLCSYWDTMREIGVSQAAKAAELLTIAQNLGWWMPLGDVCIISPKMSVLHRDGRNRLHCETGQALSYPDGWGIWAWHGVRVSQQVIDAPETIGVQEALSETNAEVRRVMLTRIGTERLAQELPPKIIDTDHDGRGMPRKLMQLGNITDRRFIAYTCPSTGREYPAQPVPPEVRTCAEAVAWRFRALDIVDGRLTRNFDYNPQQEG